MKLILTKKEVKSLVNAVNLIEPNGIKALKSSINPKKVSVRPLNGGSIEIEINPDYTEEALSVHEKYVVLLFSQTKALVQTAMLLKADIDKVIVKYS
jgi:hypothetical protein